MAKPGIAYDSDTLSEISEELRSYWETKSDYSESEEISKEDVIRKGDRAYQYAKEVLDLE